jgi:hypothetical protein
MVARDMKINSLSQFRTYQRLYGGSELRPLHVLMVAFITTFRFYREPPAVPLVGGSRPDPTYNRISNHIHSAAGQFEAVNGGCGYPNVLVFVNHDLHAGVQDLVSVLTGNAHTDRGSVLPWYCAYSEGRIREEKERIQLYLWIDVDEPEPRKFWMQSNEAHHLTLCRCLGIDPALIKQLR